MYTIDNLENDPNWKRSIGEKLDKVHFRNGHYHAECDPKTGHCKIHYDEDDPHESVVSMLKHLADSNAGKGLLIVGGLAILDQIFAGGKVRKSIMRI
ncbi:MAG: hypothetical protein K5793_04270 [Nitrosarchaeum sp.]|nr:hypothetical protein [Nitrosarchaeum sp.]